MCTLSFILKVMKLFYHKLSFLLEFLFNGSYILLYILIGKGADSEVFQYISFIQAEKAVELLVWFVPGIILFSVASNFLYYNSIEGLFRRNIFSIILAVPLFISWGDLEFTYWLASVHLFSTILSLYEAPSSAEKKARPKVQKSVWESITLKPAQLVMVSFLLIIGVGTLLLMLPISYISDYKIQLVDAIFMSTSAACVTGLSVFQIGSELTLVGQIVMLVLIQVGGLGIMTLSSSMTILLGRSLGMKEQVLMQGLLDISSLEELIDMIIEIIKLTLLIELWGAILLTGVFVYDGLEFGEALFNGVFHSVSAFCNAGFSLFPDSLERFKDNTFINLIISSLIIMGGMGFIVLKDIRVTLIQKKRGFNNLSLHTKIVLITNTVLLVLGTFGIFFSEFLNSLDDYPLYDKFLISFFQSVTTRTAGFNTISLNSLNTHTLYFMALLMFIGASPGSTGGGIKTTTFAILIQSVKATLQGRNQVEFFERQIPNQLNVRATAVAIVSLVVVSLFILILIKLEPEMSFLSVFFETLSAFGTVGLSLGITPDLSDGGKIFISLLMYIGRIGPLTLVLAVSQVKTIGGKVQYADGRVMIG
ncbi:MAG: hypothetical protein H6620_08550 [Halobacteriovoraceae bacterium]|nr:hypothetical protein [Halobacteriovoraceae bacterium]